MTTDFAREDITCIYEGIHDGLMPHMLAGEGFDRSIRMTAENLDILSRFTTPGGTPSALLVKVNSEEGTVLAEFSRAHQSINGTVDAVSACKFPVNLDTMVDQISAGFALLNAHPDSEVWTLTRFLYMPTNYEFLT